MNTTYLSREGWSRTFSSEGLRYGFCSLLRFEQSKAPPRKSFSSTTDSGRWNPVYSLALLGNLVGLQVAKSARFARLFSRISFVFWLKLVFGFVSFVCMKLVIHFACPNVFLVLPENDMMARRDTVVVVGESSGWFSPTLLLLFFQFSFSLEQILAQSDVLPMCAFLPFRTLHLVRRRRYARFCATLHSSSFFKDY